MTNTTIPNVLYPVANAYAFSNPFVDQFSTRDPGPNDTNYPIQKKWLNTATGQLFELQNFVSSNGLITANWIMLGSTGMTETLTGNSGGAVPATANNINVVGDGIYITTVGSPGTSTLTIEPAGGLTTLYTEDTGTATPMAGNLNVVGGTGVATVGSGNTITINAAGSVPLTFVEDSGSATPASNSLTIAGGTGITTSGAGHTVTIALSSSGGAIESVNVDAHTGPGTNPVVPASNAITITGGQVAASTTTNVIRTDSLAANTFTIEVQRSQAVASTTIGDNGVSHFNSANFTVDANGFVSAQPLALNYTNVNHAASPYTVLSTDYYISVDTSGGVVTLNFPNAPTAKQLWIVKDRTGSSATSNITITTPGGTVTFDGLTSYIMNSNYQAINLLANTTPTYEVY